MLMLITGGAASGKSAFAERLICALPGPRVYLAAMEPHGPEARARIARHRAMRQGKGFETVECYINAAAAPVPPEAAVLLEDLPNLAANERYRPDGRGAGAVLPDLLALADRCRCLAVVTGDLFSGSADYAGDTAGYLRALAALNRSLAARAGLVAEVVCGVPSVLKGALPWERC